MVRREMMFKPGICKGPILERQKRRDAGRLTQSLAGLLQAPDGLLLFLAHTLVLDEAGVLSDILTLDLQSGLWCLCFENKVVVAMRAVLVTLFELLDVLAERLSAFLASKDHLQGRLKVVCL